MQYILQTNEEQRLGLRANLAKSLEQSKIEFCPSFVRDLDSFTDSIVQRVDVILADDAVSRHFAE